MHTGNCWVTGQRDSEVAVANVSLIMVIQKGQVNMVT
jgi:hypothetical protein